MKISIKTWLMALFSISVLMETSLVEIQDIPDEVLSQIFSYLPTRNILRTIIDVCYRWRLIVESDVSFWKNLQIVVLCDKFINLSYLESSSNCPDLLEGFCEKEGEIVIGEKDLPKVSKVRSLTLRGDSNTTIRPILFVIRVLDKISKICKDIEKFESLHCFGATSKQFLIFLNERYDRLSEVSFGITAVWRIPYEEFSHFRNLHTLISHDYKFMRCDICTIADQCSQLQSLWILFSRYVRNDDIIYFFEKKKDTLREIGLGSSISDLALEKVKDCTNLNVLFICDARYVTRRSLEKISKLTNLRYLSLHRAKFQPQDLLHWSLTSDVLSKLRILDLTEYYAIDNGVLETLSKVTNVQFIITIS